jgi:uncharacterized membrane protein YkvA (DUF1232 family)
LHPSLTAEIGCTWVNLYLSKLFFYEYYAKAQNAVPTKAAARIIIIIVYITYPESV